MHLIMYYSELKGKIKQNHIFHCNSLQCSRGKIIPFKMKEADIDDAKTSDIKNFCKKKGLMSCPTVLIQNHCPSLMKFLTRL